MNKKLKFKRGEIFSIPTKNGFRFFQYLSDDLTQLNSNVICVFKINSQNKEGVSFNQIQLSGVDFYAHVLIGLGVRLKVWANHSDGLAQSCKDVWFRDSSDYGNPNIKVTDKWWLWQVGKPRSDINGRSNILLLSYIGIVVTPADIVDRLELGSYQFVYPKYIGQPE